ncbi:MAG: Tripartite-type tricarboxylate transporter, receptor component TctC [Hyphomicrobiales bacterium]|nr:Tripartite-type tricarboxylate transporter, receptor component TctC [Hyphomicrobiales bacterium]
MSTNTVRARLLATLGATFLVAAAAKPAQAQAPEVFYKGKQMIMLVYSPGGSTYDIYARALVRHMDRHIPGKPNFVVQNMPGAGGLKAIDYLYNIAPKDGSVIGTVGRGLPFEPMLGRAEAKFDPMRFFWVGSMNRDTSLAISWHTSKVKTMADLQSMPLLSPGTGVGADSEIMPIAFNSLAGTKFKIISGYPNTIQASLAMEMGELDGVGYWSWGSIVSSHPDWIRDKKINFLFHTGAKPLQQLPDLPSIRDYAKNDLDKKALEFLLSRETLGRPFLAPPDIPADRGKVLRAAFAATLTDPEFLRDAEKTGLEIDLVSGEEAEGVIKAGATTPPAVIDRVKSLLNR